MMKMTGKAFAAGVMWRALSSKDNAEELKAMLMLPFQSQKFVFSYVATLGAYAVLTKTGLLLFGGRSWISLLLLVSGNIFPCYMTIITHKNIFCYMQNINNRKKN